MKNQDKINKMLQAADNALISHKIVKGGTVEDGYDSAIAAFGPTVVMSGLMPSLAFYCAEGKDDSRKTNKSIVIDAIATMLFSKYNKKDHKELLKFCIEKNNDNKAFLSKLTEDIVNASVALKIMVRTYKIMKDDE